MDLHKFIHNINHLETYVDKLRQKHVKLGAFFQEDQQGISYSDIFRDIKNFSKSAIADLHNQSYKFEIAQIRTIKAGDKYREVFSYCTIDTVMAGYVAWSMNSLLEPLYSQHLFSYRKGKNHWLPVQHFAAYAREHRKKHKDPKDRGLFVIRRDIKSYTDLIPVHEKAPIWDMIKKDFQLSEDQYLFKLIKSMIRNTVIKNGCEFTMFLGIPTGQPITATLYNYYAMKLDQIFDGYPAFYTRYSDDLIFACDDKSIVLEAIGRVNDKLVELGLTFKEEKNGDFFYNGAGKSHTSLDFFGVSFIEFLGCRINFDGTVSLKKGKLKKLLNELKIKIKNLAYESKDLSLEPRGAFICQTLNQVLWGTSSLEVHKSVELLQKAVTDRTQLHFLDQQIALIISQVLSTSNSIKAFRDIPYHKIRGDWKLKSFEHQRNRYGAK